MPCKTPEDQAAAHKRWYDKNKDKKKKEVQQRRMELVKWFNEYKSKLKCKFCPENHIACIEFHHKDPSKKERNVSELARQGWSKARILKEIAKCIVICSNCHRKLHYKQK